ncbi:MAG: AAA family ATPase [Planctomycetes bacterium]|nr:AAA family ATPase [Planctomycetota bacterium]MCC7398601.1 AAA family ATPase [Planctomycetota bacterium]
MERRKFVQAALRRAPVVALLGMRQVGKSTLAREIAARRRGPVHFFDLEDDRHLARLREPVGALEPLRGLVVLDEVQRLPDLFRSLRVLADRPAKRGRRRLGFEFKHTTQPVPTKSMEVALADLKLDRLVVVHAGAASFPLGDGIQAVAAARLLEDVDPL